MVRPIQPHPQPRAFLHRRRRTTADHTAGAWEDTAQPAEHDEAGMRWGRRGFQAALAVVTLLIGAALGWLLYIQKTAPGRVEALPPPALVRVMPVYSANLPVTISGQGTVRPRSVVQLTPQVSGRIVSRHPQLLPGGFIAGGSIAVQIDPTDYQLALQQAEAGMQRLEAATQRLQTQQQVAEADLAQARTRLEVEQAEQEVAVWQYQRLHPEQSPQEMPELAARRPQIRQAEAAVEAARARLADVDQQAQELRAERAQQQAAIEQARVQLARSMVRVPDPDTEHLLYRVLESEVEVGQAVAPGQALAVVYPIHDLEVPVPVGDEALQWLNLNAEADHQVELHAHYAGTRRSWSASISRTSGQIDPRTRQVQLILTVDNAGDPERPETLLLQGMLVEASIAGQVVQDVYRLPVAALRPGEQVFVVVDERLVVRQVELVRFDQRAALVRGLQDGDRVILSPLSAPIEGMRVRVDETPAVEGDLAEDEASLGGPRVDSRGVPTTKSAASNRRPGDG